MGSVARRRPALFAEAAKLAEVRVLYQLTKAEGLQILSEVNLSFAQYRVLKAILYRAVGCDVLPPETRLRLGVGEMQEELPVRHEMKNLYILKTATKKPIRSWAPCTRRSKFT